MGNTQTSNYSEQFPLGNSPVLFLRKTKFGRGPEAVHTWTAQYNSFGSTCELELAKTNGDNNQDQELTISIHDHASNQPNDYVKFKLDVSVKESLLLGDANVTGTASVLRLPMCKIPMAQGGVLKASSYLYGTDADRKGLVVLSRARTHDDDKVLPYMITVTHYFFSAYYSHGVSLVAKICSISDDGGLSVEIEKPSKHPKTELLKMFDDVKAKGWWPDPTSSDWPIELPNQNKNPANANPFPSYHNIRSIISNGGYVYGNRNGCLTVHQHFYGSRHQRIAFNE
ncbi:hypothetical protein VNO80_20388 [Phaseolus coccineus]|uniref:Uncharacterized protein n=1 Tax=Phaseolus coccineus TaxID=3886 RepID=A0AAN9MNX5_PHACN